MIYLPNSFERYLSALRLYSQISVLKGQNKEKQIKILKKIYLAEALNSKDITPVDIINLSDALLGAAMLILMQRGIRLSTELVGNGVFLVNTRLFTAVLLETAACLTDKNSKIKVTAEKTHITVTACGISDLKSLKKTVRAMGGVYFRLENRIIIKIPLKKTESEPVKTENEWCYILDRFSPVNVWLLNVKD